MLLILWKKVSKFYIQKVSKDKKKANNSLYKLFKKFLTLALPPTQLVGQFLSVCKRN